MEEKITLKEFKKKYIKKFKGLNFIYWQDKGYIVWRIGTGENAELLHIRTFINNKGYAKELIRAMIEKLDKNQPYFSVFGFSLVSEKRKYLKEIWQKLGFNISNEIKGIYKGGPVIIFYQNFKILKKKYL